MLMMTMMYDDGHRCNNHLPTVIGACRTKERYGERSEKGERETPTKSRQAAQSPPELGRNLHIPNHPVRIGT